MRHLLELWVELPLEERDLAKRLLEDEPRHLRSVQCAAVCMGRVCVGLRVCGVHARLWRARHLSP